VRLVPVQIREQGGEALGGQEGGHSIYAVSNICSTPRRGLEAALGGQRGGKDLRRVEHLFGIAKEAGDVVGGCQGGDCGVEHTFGIVMEAGDG